MLSVQTTTVITNYWTNHLGCSAADFSRKIPTILCHSGELADYWGLLAFFREAAPVISVPADLHASLSAYIAKIPAATLGSSATFAECMQRLPGRVLGPAYLGYADETTLREPTGSARLLTAADYEAARELEASCPSLDWEHGGSLVGEQPTAGVFVDDRLVALAGYEIWGESIAHIAIVTHPEYRGRGCARSAVSVIARQALEAGLVPQYRTLMSNVPSMRVAETLGFQFYGTTVAVPFDREMRTWRGA